MNVFHIIWKFQVNCFTKALKIYISIYYILVPWENLSGEDTEKGNLNK